MLYFVSPVHAPNTAVTNRMLCYYSALEKKQIPATIVYLYPDSNLSRLDENFKYLRVNYLWDKGVYRSKVLRGFFVLLNILRFYFILKKGDIVYTHGINRLTKVILRKKGVKVYAEKTEYLGLPSHGVLSLSRDKVIQVAKRLDGLFVISSKLKDTFIQHGVETHRIQIINMTVDASRFDALEKQNVDDPYIAYCGTLSNNKDGVDRLIQAFALVAQKIKYVKLYIIGNSPLTKEAESNLSLIDCLCIKDRVYFTGGVSAKEMPQILKNAEILALARPDSEQAQCGFPTKLGEYLLTANPVVLTAVGDIPKFLTDKKSALISDADDIEGFAERLIWGLEHKDESAIIGRNGAQIARLEFNNEVETQKLIDFIYRS